MAEVKRTAVCFSPCALDELALVLGRLFVLVETFFC